MALHAAGRDRRGTKGTAEADSGVLWLMHGFKSSLSAGSLRPISRAIRVKIVISAFPIAAPLRSPILIPCKSHGAGDALRRTGIRQGSRSCRIAETATDLSLQRLSGSASVYISLCFFENGVIPLSRKPLLARKPRNGPLLSFNRHCNLRRVPQISRRRADIGRHFANQPDQRLPAAESCPRRNSRETRVRISWLITRRLPPAEFYQPLRRCAVLARW